MSFNYQEIIEGTSTLSSEYKSIPIDGSNLNRLMTIAREMSIYYYQLGSLKSFAMHEYNRWHVKRRNDVARIAVDHVKNKGAKVTHARNLADEETKETYNTEYKHKSDVERFSAFMDGLKMMLNRLNQDIARLRRIEVDNKPFENVT